jgi:hypothetical protein
VETFVVRIWVPSEAGYPAEPGLRGSVSHVASGHSESFAGTDELLAFVARMSDGSERRLPIRMRGPTAATDGSSRAPGRAEA